MAKARPRTGEKRETKQPLKIDRLPSSATDAILYLRNSQGKTWIEIEAQSACKYSKDWRVDGGGFVDWDEVSISVLELFPEMRLPHSSLHRWYDLRVEQVQQDVLVRSKQAQVVAKAFAKANLVNDDQGVINAARDTLMGILAEDGSSQGRKGAAAGLIKLGDLMQKARANSIKERKVSVDEQSLQMKLDEIKRRTEKLIQAAEAGKPGSPLQLTREQLMEHVKGIYGIA